MRKIINLLSLTHNDWRRLRKTGERADLDIIHIVSSIVVVCHVEVVYIIIVIVVVIVIIIVVTVGIIYNIGSN